MRLYTFIAAMLFGGSAFAVKPIQLTLDKALRDKALHVSLQSKGGYCTKGLALRIYNSSCRPYEITVRPGLIFRPSDTGYQNLVIASSFTMELAPDSAKTADLQTFCAKSYAHSPEKDLRYSFWKTADVRLLTVLDYIVDHNLTDHLGQSAVWCFTNNHNVSGIYDYTRPEVSKGLAALAARLKGVPAPTFYDVYRKVQGTRGAAVFNPEVLEVDADLYWNADPRNIRYHVYTMDGHVYDKPIMTEHIAKNGHRLHVRFKKKDVLPGRYYIRVFDDENYEYARQEVIIE